MANPRSTGKLYTGLTSQSFAAQKLARTQRTKEREEVKAQLEPHEELVFGEIEKLKNEIAMELGNVITLDMDKEDVKSIVYGLRLATAKMTSLETRLKNVLRKRIAAESESDDEVENATDL